MRDRCLDFIDTLWTGRAFCGHWQDDEVDCEYAFYALLALGHLSMLLLFIPPPKLAEFPLNVQLVTTGLLLDMLYIPPPELAEFPLNVQLVTTGLPALLYMPPPRSVTQQDPLALPAVMVNPSRTAVSSVLGAGRENRKLPIPTSRRSQ